MIILFIAFGCAVIFWVCVALGFFLWYTLKGVGLGIKDAWRYWAVRIKYKL